MHTNGGERKAKQNPVVKTSPRSVLEGEGCLPAFGRVWDFETC